MQSFAYLKTRMRQKAHQAFALPVVYYPTGGGPAVNLSARLHGKLVQGGDLDGQGYAAIIENVTRLVFNREELAAAVQGDLLPRSRVYLPDYGLTLVLNIRDPYDGPINERWSVSPSSNPIAPSPT